MLRHLPRSFLIFLGCTLQLGPSYSYVNHSVILIRRSFSLAFALGCLVHGETRSTDMVDLIYQYASIICCKADPRWKFFQRNFYELLPPLFWE
jgi:hypothetical protein